MAAVTAGESSEPMKRSKRSLFLRKLLWWAEAFFVLSLFALPSWAQNVTYTYDTLNRLIRAEYGNGTVIQYTYDAAGNRTGQVIRVANRSPVANAGPDQTVHGGDLVRLNGSGSDPEGNPLSFAWTQIGGRPLVFLGNVSTATLSFRAPFVRITTPLTFQLTVSNGLTSSTDTIVVTVQDVSSGIRGTGQ